MTRWIAVIAIGLIAGCATTSSPVPEGYSGPLAMIKDTVNQHSTSKADFFCLAEIDGQAIENSLRKTRRENQGRGMYMTPYFVERQVPAQAARFKIIGRTEYAAPILALTNTVYQVTGEMSFAPEAGKVYWIRGTLGEEHSAIWIEEEGTSRVIGDKIEVKGSAKLGILEK